jgi:uncharacterized membrane protein
LTAPIIAPVDHDASESLRRIDRRPPRWIPSPIIIVAALLGLATAIGLVILWPGAVRPSPASGLLARGQIVRATVILAELGPCGGVEPPPGFEPPSGVDSAECRRVTFRIEEGPDRGEQRVIDFPDLATTPRVAVSEEVLLERPIGEQAGSPYGFFNRIRTPSLFWFALLFAGLVVFLGRLRGVGALIGLAISFFVVMQFIIPGILAGQDPVAVAVVGSAAIAFVVIYLAAGFSERTTVALLGTLSGLGIAFVIAKVWVPLAKLTGLGTEESFVISALGLDVDLTGLLLAGVVIGALGAIDDVAVTQVASVWELKKAQPNAGPRTLYRSAMRIGRDHVGSIVNTLVLAYAGASLPLLILITVSQQSASQVLGTEALATELVRTFAGSIGLIMAMPISTWLAARATTNVVAGSGD